MISVPGLYDITMVEYCADPCPEPSFSASCGKLLLQMSPKHAWMEHPKLGNKSFKPSNVKADFGSVVHELVLGNGSAYRIIKPADYLNKDGSLPKKENDAMKAAKAAAIEEGLTPIRDIDFERAQAAAAEIRSQLPEVFVEGEAERTMIWKDKEIWCRARPDWLVCSQDAILDLKITGTNISPIEKKLERHIFEMWYDLTAAHYMDGYAILFGAEPVYWFLFVEDRPPFSIRPFRLSGQGIEMGKRKLEAARSWWRRCLQDGRWPGIEPSWDNVADPEPWQATNWLTYDGGLSDYESKQAIEFHRPLEEDA